MKSEREKITGTFNLRFCVKDRKTITKFPVSKRNALVFTNESDNALTIKLDRKDVLLDEKNNLIGEFKVGGGKTRQFLFDRDMGGELKYSATIQDAATEDPIIILED